MAFDLRDGGFHIVLSKDVPEIVRTRIAPLVAEFLARHNLTRREISAFLLHPGGRKLLSNIERELQLCRCGNLSSATILFILDARLSQHDLSAGAYGLVAAFGPGFSAELVLLQWT